MDRADWWILWALIMLGYIADAAHLFTAHDDQLECKQWQVVWATNHTDIDRLVCFE